MYLVEIANVKMWKGKNGEWKNREQHSKKIVLIFLIFLWHSIQYLYFFEPFQA